MHGSYIDTATWMMYLGVPAIIFFLLVGMFSAALRDSSDSEDPRDYDGPYDEAREKALWAASYDANRIVMSWLLWGVIPAGGLVMIIVASTLGMAIHPLAANAIPIAVIAQWSVPPLMRFVIGPYVLHVHRWWRVVTFLAIYSVAVLAVLAGVGGFMGWVGIGLGLLGRALPYILIYGLIVVIFAGVARSIFVAIRNSKSNRMRLIADLRHIALVERADDKAGSAMNKHLQTQAEANLRAELNLTDSTE